jgi:hypothetical protein
MDQFHGEEPMVTVGGEFVQLRQVAVTHIRERSKLALESIERFGGDVLKRLEREVGSGGGVEDLVDDAETSLANLPADDEAFGPAKILGAEEFAA